MNISIITSRNFKPKSSYSTMPLPMTATAHPDTKCFRNTNLSFAMDLCVLRLSYNSKHVTCGLLKKCHPPPQDLLIRQKDREKGLPLLYFPDNYNSHGRTWLKSGDNNSTQEDGRNLARWIICCLPGVLADKRITTQSIQDSNWVLGYGSQEGV